MAKLFELREFRLGLRQIFGCDCPDRKFRGVGKKALQLPRYIPVLLVFCRWLQGKPVTAEPHSAGQEGQQRAEQPARRC